MKYNFSWKLKDATSQYIQWTIPILSFLTRRKSLLVNKELMYVADQSLVSKSSSLYPVEPEITSLIVLKEAPILTALGYPVSRIRPNQIICGSYCI